MVDLDWSIFNMAYDQRVVCVAGEITSRRCPICRGGGCRFCYDRGMQYELARLTGELWGEG